MLIAYITFFKMEKKLHRTYSKSEGKRMIGSPARCFSAYSTINESINNQKYTYNKNAATLTSGCIKTEFNFYEIHK